MIFTAKKPPLYPLWKYEYEMSNFMLKHCRHHTNATDANTPLPAHEDIKDPPPLSTRSAYDVLFLNVWASPFRMTCKPMRAVLKRWRGEKYIFTCFESEFKMCTCRSDFVKSQVVWQPNVVQYIMSKVVWSMWAGARMLLCDYCENMGVSYRTFVLAIHVKQDIIQTDCFCMS